MAHCDVNRQTYIAGIFAKVTNACDESRLAIYPFRPFLSLHRLGAIS